MKRLLTTASLALAMATLAGLPTGSARADEAPAATGDVPAAELQEARGLMKAFATRLMGELQNGIEDGGPAHAIGVCGAVAPAIAGSVSDQGGWAIGRTALKVRNPRNSPSVRERAVLMDFQQRHAAGEDFKNMESAAIIEEGNRRYLHYMKAIPTQDLCLACHGSDVAPEVQQAIHARYPADAATGFALGELRGAFTFVKPLTPN
ncbi:DUF3365 domain-containing protein [Rhodovibrio salinarum]|uniref:DUF3365 domain-containing protein n=2 Tax=Rhodovibrio salinarum TaxID=1087 RepID=A0A934QHX6_9PROT|nr:DUF3365 domain-containing protein [Rhodovibrio salinarum]